MSVQRLGRSTHESVLLFVVFVFKVDIEAAPDEAADETPQRILDVGAVSARQARDEARSNRGGRGFVDRVGVDRGELADEGRVQERRGTGARA